MSTGRAKTVYVVLCLCLVAPAAVFAGTLCAMDDSNNIVVLKTDSDLAAGAIIGLHGSLTGAETIPMHGTAIVDSAGASVKIVIQGINGIRHQHVGIAVDTDLMLNGSGTFENVNPGRPFTYQIVPVTWTGLDPCP